MAQAVPNLCVSRKVLLKHQVNWNTETSSQLDDLGWLCTNQGHPVHSKDKPWFDDQCRHAFGLKQEAHLQWTRDRSRVNWEEFVRCQVRANETYSEVSLVTETGMFL